VSVETPPEATEPTPTGQRCPRCGAPMGERQEWCLNCGAAVGTRVESAPGWRVPFAIAGAILAIAAIAIIIALVQLADDTGEVAQNQPAASTPTPPPAVTPEASVTPDPALPEASGMATPEPTPQTPSGDTSADAEWPAGETGWTVVLAADSSESDARGKADDFAQDGIAGVGVIDTDDFGSLEGDLWVVFAGHYATQAEASEALDGIDAKDAYIRRLVPD
jgi:cell division septation protein DedD